MRLRVVILPLVLMLAVALASAVRPDAARAPKYADITAACTPGGKGHVSPPTIAMKRADNIEWRSVSPRAVSWTITPKDPADWPFDDGSFTGTERSGAVTPSPRAAATLNHAYRYNVTVVCRDGTSETIDPDIIIGE